MYSKKQTLIHAVGEGEAKATATKELYRNKLANLQKEYDKSMKDLEEARKKITQLENSGTLLFPTRLDATVLKYLFHSFLLLK